MQATTFPLPPEGREEWKEAAHERYCAFRITPAIVKELGQEYDPHGDYSVTHPYALACSLARARMAIPYMFPGDQKGQWPQELTDAPEATMSAANWIRSEELQYRDLVFYLNGERKLVHMGVVSRKLKVVSMIGNSAYEHEVGMVPPNLGAQYQIWRQPSVEEGGCTIC